MGDSGGRVDISDWEFVGVETRGASEKFWVRRPGGSSRVPSDDWLFKPVTVHDDGSRQAGDWTEATASAVARAIGVPSAQSQLATRAGLEGVIVRNVRPAGYDMVTGRLAMLHDIDVELSDSKRDKTASIGHSIVNIFRSLEGYGPVPEETSWSTCTGADVMVAYLLLDALIANGDRHEQNWSVLRASSSDDGNLDAVSATYDLEASLGFQLTDESRSSRLRDRRGMEKYARKGLARRFDGDRNSTLVDVAVCALGRCSDDGRRRIDEVLEAIATVDYDEIVEGCSPVSEVTRRFAAEVLKINGRRICDAI